MKAVLCKAWGPPESLVVEERPSLVPEAGKVVIGVRAAGVNFPDTLIIQDKYQYKPELPFSPGGEVAGVVKAVGAGVEGWAIGDKVVAQTIYGGFAEEVATEPNRILPLPEGMDFATGASIGLAYGTSHYALVERGGLKAGETLLVLGASGGVGLAAVEIGKVIGAKVIACASTEAKLEICRQHGADETINYVDEDMRARVKAITQGKGVDVVYDPVGGRYSELALRDMAWGGRLLVVGFADGEIPKIPLNLPLIKGCSIVGVWWGQWAKGHWEQHGRNVAQLGQWYREGRIKPRICASFPLERAAEALNVLAQRKVTGKVVLTVAG
jgi:NADPH2:quinone reductase